MSLYERFNDETEFRENFVKPLLNRLGYYGVSELHGTQEFGKDFVFSELHRLGGMKALCRSPHEVRDSVHPNVAIEDETELVFFVEHGAFDRPLLRIGRADAVKKCQLLLLKVLPSV